jgi:hypothetical protein
MYFIKFALLSQESFINEYFTGATNFSGVKNRQSAGYGKFGFIKDYRILHETVMDEPKLPEIEIEKLKKLPKEDIDDCIAEVVKAIDTAKIGSIIDDSEETVLVAAGKLRQKIE